MSLLILKTAACALFASLALYYRNKSRSRLPLPPGLRKLPLVGNLFNIPPTFQWETYMEWSKKYDSDIIHLDVAGTSIIVLSSAAVANDLLEKRFEFRLWDQWFFGLGAGSRSLLIRFLPVLPKYRSGFTKTRPLASLDMGAAPQTKTWLCADEGDMRMGPIPTKATCGHSCALTKTTCGHCCTSTKVVCGYCWVLTKMVCAHNEVRGMGTCLHALFFAPGVNGKLNPAMQSPDAAFGFGRRDSLWITIASILAAFDITKAVDDDGRVIEPTFDIVPGMVWVLTWLEKYGSDRWLWYLFLDA
ncbi:hypothetical protein FB451DRAFT_1174801 [Mycena latifolia]|nr:hypothetical protein FB451DRAFT_1174801 [Mycena latifolia]